MPTRDEYVSIVQSAFITLGKNAAMKFLVSNFPFMGWNFLNPIVGYFVGLIVEALARETEMQAFFLYIDLRVKKQSESFEKAAAENFEAQRGTDETRKKLAEDNLKREFAAFVRLSS